MLGENVRIAILDDGLAWQHPDISQNYWAPGSYDVNFKDNDPTPSIGDNHGTRSELLLSVIPVISTEWVQYLDRSGGTAAARDNDICGVGTAPHAKLAGVRLLAKVLPR